MKRFIPVIVAVIAIAGAYWYGHQPVPNPDPNHTHADFAVWVNGQQLNFTDPTHMSEAYEEGKEVRVDPLRKYLHLHDGNGRVLHRHKPGLTFGEFLQSLGFHIDPYDDNNDGGCFSDGIKMVCDSGLDDQNYWSLYVNGMLYDGLNLNPPVKNTMLALAKNYAFQDNDQILLTYGADVIEIQHELSLMTNDACTYSKTCPWRGDPPTENCIADPTIPCVAP